MSFGTSKIKMGVIEVIIGPMFSGKTTELNRRLRRYEIAKKKVFRIRYKNDNVETTHDKIEKTGVKTTKLMDLKNKVLNYDVIGIDEAQFFSDLIEFAEYCTLNGIRVIIAGCDADFERKPFGKILELIPKAEYVQKLQAVCVYCGVNAGFSLRITNATEQELMGAEHYKAVCRTCYHEKTIK